MQDNYTFGWESEFGNGADALVRAMHTEGLLPSPEMHGYHCRCETCEFGNGYSFRAQNDSSCGGEIISDVQDDIGEGRELMDHLQRLAIAVDAEPSMDAGLHVHVGVAGVLRVNALWAYLRWENILGTLVAPGRWPGIRPNNTPARRSLAYEISDSSWDWSEDVRSTGILEASMPWRRDRYGDIRGDFDPLWVERQVGGENDALRVIRSAVYDSHSCADRHSWLNLNTRNSQTFEFRLWNATRVAWRMEMFVRTSLLFMNHDAMEELLRLSTNPTQTNLLGISARHDPALKRLLRRQLDAPKTDEPFLSTLTGAEAGPSRAHAPRPDEALRWDPVPVDYAERPWYSPEDDG